MFTLDVRKQHTNLIINVVKQFMRNITNNDFISGFIIMLVHWIFTGVSLIYILIGEINYWFYVSCIIWIGIFVAHWYFAGCICTRIEKKLFDASDWKGPWVFLFMSLERLNITVTSSLANTIFIAWGSLITGIAWCRCMNTSLIRVN